MTGLRRAVTVAAALNLAYFGVEFAVAQRIGSVSLFADSIDFLEDTSVNALVLLALRWSARRRAVVGMSLSLLLLAPGVATIWAAVQKLTAPVAPDPAWLSLVGLGALAINLCCALLLALYRASGGSLVRAAFLSARNDVIANVAIMAAGLITGLTASIWPDLLVGVGVFWMNLDAAQEVFAAARSELNSEAAP